MISPVPQEALQGSSLLARVQKYTSPSNGRSIAQILTSFVPFVATWYLMLRSLQVSYWLTLVLAVFAAGFLVRLFIIQHDCGHGSFFRSRRANDIVGSLLGVLTLTPYKSWRRQHAIHHATSGNLDQRGVGDIQTLTVEEYRALSRWRKLLYRIYRHPALLFGAGAITQFVVLYRTTLHVPRTWRSERLGVHWTNLGLVSLIALLGELIGWRRFLLVQLPITAISCSAGVWLFYVQHQFENTYWERESKWDYSIAAIQGSSHYALPKVLQWFTGNIGLHHIHHLSSRIPNYRLQKVLDEVPALQNAPRLTFWKSLRCAGLTLWDEQQQKLISYRAARKAFKDRRPLETAA